MRTTAAGIVIALPVRAIMVDREKVLTVLRRRFPSASEADRAAAANAIVGLDEEWEEVDCTDLRELIDRLRAGHEFRLLERLGPPA
jgi:hypothetical protein